jgi:2-isopropylmalate synthase
MITGVSVTLESYSLNSVNEGIEALATTRVSIMPRVGGPNDSASLHSQLGPKNRKFSGTGSDTDIITSSARAYTSALNKLLKWNMRQVDHDHDHGADGSTIGDAEAAGPMPVAQVSS